MRLLCLQRMAGEKTVKLRLAAGEFFDRVSSLQFFYAQRVRHCLASKTDGSRNRRLRRG